jgi:hypothetical protein
MEHPFRLLRETAWLTTTVRQLTTHVDRRQWGLTDSEDAVGEVLKRSGHA